MSCSLQITEYRVYQSLTRRSCLSAVRDPTPLLPSWTKLNDRSRFLPSPFILASSTDLQPSLFSPHLQIEGYSTNSMSTTSNSPQSFPQAGASNKVAGAGADANSAANVAKR